MRSNMGEPGASALEVERTQHWAVTVSRNGEEIVTIESNCLSGRELSNEDERVIRNAAEHLLSFVGTGILEDFSFSSDEVAAPKSPTDEENDVLGRSCK